MIFHLLARKFELVADLVVRHVEDRFVVRGTKLHLIFGSGRVLLKEEPRAFEEFIEVGLLNLLYLPLIYFHFN